MNSPIVAQNVQNAKTTSFRTFAKWRIETMAGSHFYIYFMGEWKIDYLDEFLGEM